MSNSKAQGGKPFRSSWLSYLFFFAGGAMMIAAYLKSNAIESNHETVSGPAVSYQSAAIIRLEESEFVHPVLYEEGESSSSLMQGIKQNVSTIIDNYKSQGILKNASVYIRKLNESGAVSINPEFYYDPGSMMKVPIMIAHLRTALDNPSWLSQKIEFPGRTPNMPVEVDSKPILVAGKVYTVKQLIETMIIHSDNDAVVTLLNNLEEGSLNKVLKDLKITERKNAQSPMLFGVNEYERFFTVLYNASYVSKKDSEWAMQLLSKTVYNKSLTRTMTGQFPIAHKYGIAEFPDNLYLNEAGIFFKKDNPYLLVVMTNGTNTTKQSDVISEISAAVYHAMESGPL